MSSLSLTPVSHSHYVHDPVLAEIRAKLSAARQAAHRPSVSYRAGLAPIWALTHQHDEKGGLSESVVRSAVEYDSSTRVVRCAALVATAAERAIRQSSPTAEQPAQSHSQLAVPEPEDDSEDEHDAHIRLNRSNATAHLYTESGHEEVRQDEQRESEDRLPVDEAEAEERSEEGDDSSAASCGSSPSPPPSHLLPFKPVFKPRATRVTVGERCAIDDDEWRLQEAEEQQSVRRQQQTRAQLKSDMDRAAQRVKQRQLASEYGVRQSELTDMPDDSSDSEEEDRERDAWKLRELQRLERDREALQRRVKREREEEEQLASEEGQHEASLLRSLRAESTVGRDNRQRGMQLHGSSAIDDVDTADGQSRSPMRFLQRYYHVGAFFADERGLDDSFKRDFNAATGEDRAVDKQLLPAVMQVKKFGRKGRTKYTHLTDQDTSLTRRQPADDSSGPHNIRRAAEVGVRGYTRRGVVS